MIANVAAAFNSTQQQSRRPLLPHTMREGQRTSPPVFSENVSFEQVMRKVAAF